MRALPLIAVLLASYCASGCSSSLSEVSGTVTLNGQPLPEGAINFIPVEGTRGAGAGATIRDGKYHVPAASGVTPGKNRVELRAFRSTGKKVKDAGVPGATEIEQRVPAFPPEYNDQSTLVREIRQGSNTIDFEISVPDSATPMPPG